jgi:hypothetical protein
MKFILTLSCLITISCSQQRNASYSPYSDREAIVLIEINSVPPPFDINSKNPYAVWINGKKVDPPIEYIEALVHKVGEENIPKINKKDIHKGWLHPWYVSISQEEQKKGRTRIVGER